MCGFHGNTAGHALGQPALAHRGPDSYGIFRDGNLVLEHWRLSIIDLSANGAQPMALDVRGHAAVATAGDAAAHVIAYNGEVYNFRELREGLRGEHFHSTTDTEVLLRMYAQEGLKCLPKLNGMFAFALYDKAAGRLVLARDRFGIKPLYYHVDAQGQLHFASELNALLRDPSIARTPDPAAVQSLFHLLYIEGERTPFQEIRKLAPGSYLVYDLETRRLRIERYHRFEFRPHGLSDAACVQRIDELLGNSVRMHMVSDVPVGALLSGGVDSSVMVALMRRHTDKVHTFSVGYEDNRLFDESKYFNRVAQQYQTDHHHTVIRQDALPALVDEVCPVLDEPIGDTSVFLNYFIFGFVSRSVKVCLSGLGGDELFGGYNRYLACKLLPVYTGMPAPFRRGLQSLLETLPSSRGSRIGNKVRLLKTFLRQADPDLGRAYCNFIDYFFGQPAPPVLTAAPFTNERFDAYWDERAVDELNRIYRYDIENYMVNDLLQLTDRMSMRHSLEARVPFLENDLVDFALGIDPRRKITRLNLKQLLKKVAERYIPREVIYRRKQGFSSPVSGLLSGPMLDSLLQELNTSTHPHAQMLNRPLFSDMIAAHRQRREDYSLQIFTLFMYLRWMGKTFGVSSR